MNLGNWIPRLGGGSRNLQSYSINDMYIKSLILAIFYFFVFLYLVKLKRQDKKKVNDDIFDISTRYLYLNKDEQTNIRSKNKQKE
jgi:hypothetical protein